MKTIKTDVLIIIEHKVRELDSVCLLKYEFEKKGKKVIIDSIYPNKEALPYKYSASIIILPWAYSNKEMDYIKCFLKKSPNAVFLNLHHEQYSGQDDRNICLPTEESINMYHISWGKKFTKGLLDSNCSIDSIIESGNIKLDFYKGKLINWYYNKKELAQKYHIPNNKKWILFIANGFHLMHKWKIDSIANSDPLIYEKVDASIACREEFLNYVDEFLKKNKEAVFIYRPHPVYAELDKNEKIVSNLKKKYSDNFFVIEDLSIGNWLVNCDICMSFHSTAAVECCMCKTPYYLFRTTPLNPKQDYPFFENYKYIIKNYKDFNEVVNKIKYDNNHLRDSLSDYYNLTKDYSFRIIVNEILSKEPIHINKPTFIMKAKNYIRYFIKESLIILAKIGFIKKVLIKTQNDRIVRIVENSTDNITKDDIINIEGVIMKCFDGKEKRL